MTPQTNQWAELLPEAIPPLELKAQGAAANVYRARLPPQKSQTCPTYVAVRKPRITSILSIARFEAELRLRSKLHHPNILPLLAACTSAPHYCTISPWMHGGTLFDILHTRSVSMSFQRLAHISLQFARAMAYMHKSNLVHRDLKTSNLLLDQSLFNLVIADLDLAMDVTELENTATINGGRAVHRGPSNGRLSHMVGTLVYMSPEVLKGRPHSFAADVYAFAITVNEMATCAVPFVDRKLPVPELHTVLETRFNQVKLRSAIVKNHLRPVLATGVPPEFAKLIETCWHSDPQQRPTFDEIVDILDDMVTRGPEYLSQFTGSTFKTEDHVAAISQTRETDTFNIVLEEIQQHARKPRKPIWEMPPSVNKAIATMNINIEKKPLQISAALSSTCGERGADCMEDRSIVMKKLTDLPNTHLFAVFDGHGGQACSEFAEAHFPGALFRAWVNEAATPESALIHAFEDVDLAFLKHTSAEENSGCTALAALIVHPILYVANAGDCRCVLSRKDGTAIDLSKDHVATDSDEKARVYARGGFVSVTGRVQGCLMVSRAIGDRSIKRYISATPEVITKQLTPDDDFLILASDGLWDVVSSQEAASLVRSTVRVPDLAAKRLCLKALELGSDDNISVIIVFFGGNVDLKNHEN